MGIEVWVKDLFKKVGKKLLVAQSRAVAEGFIIPEPFFCVYLNTYHTTLSQYLWLLKLLWLLSLRERSKFSSSSKYKQQRKLQSLAMTLLNN